MVASFCPSLSVAPADSSSRSQQKQQQHPSWVRPPAVLLLCEQYESISCWLLRPSRELQDQCWRQPADTSDGLRVGYTGLCALTLDGLRLLPATLLKSHLRRASHFHKTFDNKRDAVLSARKFAQKERNTFAEIASRLLILMHSPGGPRTGQLLWWMSLAGPTYT